jgi:hypothetical protein
MFGVPNELTHISDGKVKEVQRQYK